MTVSRSLLFPVLLASLALLALDPPDAVADSRGSLGEAVEKAKKKDSDPVPFGSQTKKKGEPAVEDSDHDDSVWVGVGIYGTGGGSGPRYESASGGSRREPMRFFVSVAGGGGGGHAYARSRSVETAIGFSPMPGLRFDVSGLLASPEFDASTGVDGAFSHMFDPAVGISARVYPNLSRSFTGVYAHAGYRWGRLVWDWTNPVRVEEPSGAITEISGDRLAYSSYYGGLGVSAPVGVAFRAGLSVGVGWREYAPATHERFDNDVFSSGLFGQIRVELGWMSPAF